MRGGGSAPAHTRRQGTAADGRSARRRPGPSDKGLGTWRQGAGGRQVPGLENGARHAVVRKWNKDTASDGLWEVCLCPRRAPEGCFVMMLRCVAFLCNHEFLCWWIAKYFVLVPLYTTRVKLPLKADTE
ncbi:hypothetical protein JM93_00931 [Roseibium hamelinense]|uniref:Uncharacterized protein n=1 Tax=Roseibium hamelinense TaxID=150831 RepID=A0A562TIA9_9HYPH|nr:hypothetical protein JM93_00931 [Roseibium hamelinense]